MKIKLNQNAGEDIDAVVEAPKAGVAGLEHVWTIGRTILIFRASRTKATEYPLSSKS
jgi:RNA-binding protein